MIIRMNEDVARYATLIIYKQYLDNSYTIGDIDILLDNYFDLALGRNLFEDEKKELKHQVVQLIMFEESRKNRVEDPAMLVDPTHVEWYEDWLLQRPYRYNWERLNSFISRKLQKKYPQTAGSIVKSIDNASDKIVCRLHNPSLPSFQTKGLVLGYVQSGKTENFTTVIAKAVDAGYRMVIVLSGIHNNLRAQTQERLDVELTGEPDQSDLESVPAPQDVGRQWYRMTTKDLDFDSLRNHSRLDNLVRYSRPMLAVMKKNCSVMRKLISWLEDASYDSRACVPLLIIDDEADQASIDTSNKDKDTDPTETNKLIRQILSLMPRHAYIGYTATPFANVFIDKDRQHTDWGRDLYPKNFIVSLPRPDGYMGAEQIFTSGQNEHYVRLVPQHEINILIPKRKKKAPRGLVSMTDKLEHAILSFVLAAAARYERGDRNEPMTMLVHTSSLQYIHRQTRTIVENYCTGLYGRWDDLYEREELRGKLLELWENDFVPVTNKQQYEVIPFNRLEQHIGDFLADLHVLELNSSSDEELDYTKKPGRPGIKVVAVGGNRLSRGLTLEGLMTSFYLRDSKAYDTLLQMGRWFGYRQGYEDLTRIYTSEQLAKNFEELSLVEQEIRDEIKCYEGEITPEQLPVRIRASAKMKITAKNKMGAAQQVQGSFSDRLAQTIWFDFDQPQHLEHNLIIGKEFISELEFKKVEKGTSYVAENVPVDRILSFLQDYRFYAGDEASLDNQEMIRYITRHASRELNYWNVVVPGQQKEKNNDGNRAVDFGGVTIIPHTRSRLKDKKKIGAVSDPAHLVLDLEGVQRGERPSNAPPVLVLYRIWSGSGTSNGNLTPLFQEGQKKVDLLALVIKFPKSRVEPSDYYSQLF